MRRLIPDSGERRILARRPRDTRKLCSTYKPWSRVVVCSLD